MPKSKQKQFVVESVSVGSSPSFYLDSFDGGNEYHWTADLATAWRMSYVKAAQFADRIRVNCKISVKVTEA